MSATTIHAAPTSARAATLLAMEVDGEACTVRATPVWPIAEVLDIGDHFEGLVAAGAECDPQFVADAIESRMIASPRLRRRQRAVSSRALFFAGS